MLITSKLEIDLQQPGFKKVAYAVQSDSNTRALEVSLFLGSTAWEIPSGTTAAVSFRKMDLTSGLYDTLPDGSTKAVTFSGNTLTAILAPQVLTCAGKVDISIALYDSSLNRLGVFPVLLYVSADPSAGKSISNNYYYLSTLAAVNEAIGDLNGLKTSTKESLVAAINELAQGTVTEDQIQDAVDAYLEKNGTGSILVDPTLTKEGYAADAKATGEAISKVSGQNGNGLTETASNLLIKILRDGIYSSDQSANITALATELGVVESGGGDTPDEPDEPVTPEVTLSSISATYSGGEVAVGTAVADLTGIVVTAHYSDGTSEAVTGYTLSGEIAEGENTITVSYGGKTTTFTVNGIAESTGENNGWTDGEAYEIEWTDGYTVNNGSGEEEENTARSVSGFIPVLGVSALTGGAGINGGYLYAYDADKIYLGRIIFNTTNPAAVNRNVAFVKIVCLTTNKATATLTPHVYEELTDSTAWEAGKFYQASYLSGKGINSNTGAEQDKANYWASDFMLCYGATSIYTMDTPQTSWRNWGVFYDADKNYISGDTGNLVPWTVPENAAYFRLTGFDGFEYTIQKPDRPWIKFE